MVGCDRLRIDRAKTARAGVTMKTPSTVDATLILRE